MKMSEDPSKWGEMIEELKRYRKVDGDCAAVLGQCYAWGMGVFCDADKVLYYLSLAEEMNSPLGIILKHHSGERQFPTEWQSLNLKFIETLTLSNLTLKIQPDETILYPPYLYYRALRLSENDPLQNPLFKICQDSGLHRAYLFSKEYVYHSVTEVEHLMDAFYFHAEIDSRYELSRFPLFKFHYNLCQNQNGFGPRFTTLHELMKRGIPAKTLTLSCGGCAFSKPEFIAALPYLAPTLKKIVFNCRLSCQWTPLINLQILTTLPHLRTIKVTGDVQEVSKRLDWLIPILSNIRKLNFESERVPMSGMFIRAASQNRNLAVCGIKPDIPLLVTVSRCLTSLFPSWFPTQLKDMVISQVWCLKKLELLKDLK